LSTQWKQLAKKSLTTAAIKILIENCR
jgi:hypothetical protein